MENLSNINLIFMFILCFELVPIAQASCPPGNVLVPTAVHSQYDCIPCLSGTFNPFPNRFRCEDCTYVDPDDPYKVEVAACTLTEDTVVKCKHPWHYFDGEKRDCLLCSVCNHNTPYVGKNCSDYEDTHCCPEENMDVVDGECIKYPLCGIKEMFVYRAVAGRIHVSCEQCPANTTNCEDRHWRTDCKEECLELNENNKNVVERFSGCEPGETDLGESCYKRGVVLCSPQAKEFETPRPVKPLTTQAVIVSPSFALLTLCIVLGVFSA